MKTTSYSDDIAFLKEYTQIVELSAPGGAKVAVAPEFQGRVMTSALSKAKPSFGFVNRPFIQSRQESPAFNNYGGEDRFWLGPEGGQFALWFQKGQAFDLATWHTPGAFGSGSFEVTAQTRKSVTFAKLFSLANFSGTMFNCGVKRAISALGREQAADHLGVDVPEGVKMVGFQSLNTLSNTGSSTWTKDGGLLSVWILGQFKPLPRGKVIVPFAAGDEETLGTRATTDYFLPLGADRCPISADHMLFACDGKYRSKIGISPARAKSVLGSYDPDGKVLTIVQFNLPCGAPRLPYVSSLWKIQDKPFAGDVVNSYNDGAEDPNAAQQGAFYELETSSPAAELAPGGSITHIHRTFHFVGKPEALSTIAMKALGVDLAEIG